MLIANFHCMEAMGLYPSMYGPPYQPTPPLSIVQNLYYSLHTRALYAGGVERRGSANHNSFNIVAEREGGVPPHTQERESQGTHKRGEGGPHMGRRGMVPGGERGESPETISMAFILLLPFSSSSSWLAWQMKRHPPRERERDGRRRERERGKSF